MMFRYREVELNYSDIFRVFISGSSGSGKTYFAHKLLRSNLFSFNRIYYFHPDIHENSPVDWEFDDIVFCPGIPSLNDILEIPEQSVLIFDDLYHECINAQQIDYLYRVLSGKRKFHCIIMTQRYFDYGRFSLSIRNSSNYHVLMRNADERTNTRAAYYMNLKTEIMKANEIIESEYYPYIFVDKTPAARVSGMKVYIDIFSKYRKVIVKSMLYYLIAERDFTNHFLKVDKKVAIRHEAAKQENKSSSAEKEPEPIKTPIQSADSDKSSSKGCRQKERRKLERSIRKIVHRRSKRAFL